MGLLKLVPVWAYGAAGAAALAALVAVGVWSYNRGQSRAIIDIKEQIVTQERETLRRNRKFDDSTTDDDRQFYRDLRELENKWLFADTKDLPEPAKEKPELGEMVERPAEPISRLPFLPQSSSQAVE